MLRLLRRRVMLHEWSIYILNKGLFLTFLFLLTAVSLPLISSSWLADQYAEYLTAMGAVLLGAALLGSLLVEDVLRKTK